MIEKKVAKDLPIWQAVLDNHKVAAFSVELTARCNFSCRHCYICKKADDCVSAAAEPTKEEIFDIAGEAVSRGALWCNITGGEPLLRRDFEEIYLKLKRMGLLVTLFTNASLITEEKADFFAKYPPYITEVTLYGATKECYERVTGVAGSYDAAYSGIERLKKRGIDCRLKAMVIKSNLDEFEKIYKFGSNNTVDYYRYDSQLTCRLDGDEERNKIIRGERLSPEETVRAELYNSSHKRMIKNYSKIASQYDKKPQSEEKIIKCGAGRTKFVLGADGKLRLCTSLSAPEYCYDIRNGSFADFWDRFIPEVRTRTSSKPVYLEKCACCKLKDLCLWCPAICYLEKKEMDVPVEEFCAIAQAKFNAGISCDNDEC